MSTKVKIKTFSKKEAQHIIVMFRKDLLNIDLSESEKEKILDFKKYLKKLNLECIVTSREKIIYSFGIKVDKYLNHNISDYLSSCIDDKNLTLVRASFLEITNKKYIKGIYLYQPITFRKNNIGSIIFISSKQPIKEQLDLIYKF